MSLGFARDSMLDLAAMAEKSSSAGNGGGSEVSDEIDAVNRVGEPSSELPNGYDKSKRVDFANGTSSTSSKASRAAPKTNRSRIMPPASAYGQYAGFAEDYAEYENAHLSYNVDPYAPSLFGSPGNGGGFNLLHCLFPWLQQSQIEDEEEDQGAAARGGVDQERRPTHEAGLSTRSDDTDEVASTGSEAYGEKMTDKEQKAVLARLRLVQPDSSITIVSPEQTPTAAKSEDASKLELDSGKEESDKKSKKGILKRGSVASNSATAAAIAAKRLEDGENGKPRRSLFPVYESNANKDTAKHSVSFAPMARVVTVKARLDMTYMERSSVWWQKKDYDDFKKTGRIIAKAMLEGGSEVWLATNKSWQMPKQKLTIISPANPNEASKQNPPRAFHLSDRNAVKQDDQIPGERVSAEDTGAKWWCKFGHSRRGLEHIASMDEGRQRQANVRGAIRMVVDEQRRQKIYRKEDPEKIRMVSIQYTSWARDLALAAGSADAEAVRSNFSQEAKSREFYIFKNAKANVGSTKPTPAFMKASGVLSPQQLDANTASQIRYRRKQVAPSLQRQPSVRRDPREEAIHDPDPQKDNLAKKAAGFGIENKNMSAVLTGMGTMDKSKGSPIVSQSRAVTSIGAH